MTATLPTLLLDLTNWDLVVDSAGNIALATPPYSTAQDVASAIKTFLAECFYDTTLGISYLGNQPVLGGSIPIGIFKAYMVQAALTVPGVVSAQCVINSFVGRKVVGQVTFTDDRGVVSTLNVASSGPGISLAWTADSSVTADSNIYTAAG